MLHASAGVSHASTRVWASSSQLAIIVTSTLAAFMSHASPAVAVLPDGLVVSEPVTKDIIPEIRSIRFMLVTQEW